MNNDYIWDIETYPNVITFGFHRVYDGAQWVFEISDRRNDIDRLIAFIFAIRDDGARLVGFNSIGFDYPVLHYTLGNTWMDAGEIYDKAMSIIQSDEKFAHMVWESDWVLPQIDLFKIHHFDNRSKSTSLKVLAFNMRSPNIVDLPYPVGVPLESYQIDVLIKYMFNDIKETLQFYYHTADAIRFREELSAKYDRNFLNHNDTKIGKDYLIMRLGDDTCYYRDDRGKKQPRQTWRESIKLADIIFPYIDFWRPEFKAVLDWLKGQTIRETKGVFKDVHCVVDGFRFDFGTGGIHGSVPPRIVHTSDTHVIIDLDVASFYPSLAIANKLRPEHLGESFSAIYADLKSQRAKFAKGTPENAMLKLAQNGAFGDSNSVYSPFYDPAYTMSITINGQLLLCMLAEQLMSVDGLQMIQANTDGLTVLCPRDQVGMVGAWCKWWEGFTGLVLEQNIYSRMFIRDVNNYIAEYLKDGKLKRKGAYEYKLEWHQNHSALVIQKAAEAALVRGVDIRQFITTHNDHMDFMLRAKVPRASQLMLGDRQVQNVTRYHIAKSGAPLVKVMPPLPGKDKERRIGIDVGWNVAECNDISTFDPGNINYEYYIKEAEKLVRPLL